MLPVATVRRCAAHAPAAAPTTAGRGLVLVLHAPPRSPGSPRRGCSASCSGAARHDARHVDRLALIAAAPCCCRRADLVRPRSRRSCWARRCRRAARGVRRAGAGAAAVHGRAGRHRRPGHPQTGDVDALARTVRFAVPEVLVAVVTAAAHRRSPAFLAARCWRCRCCSASPISGSAPAGTCGARRRATCRARGVRRAHRRPHRDRRGRPHRRGAGARQPPASRRIDERHRGRRPPPSATRCRCGRSFPPSSSPTLLPSSRGCCWAASWSPTATPRSAQVTAVDAVRPAAGRPGRPLCPGSTRSRSARSLARLLGIAQVPAGPRGRATRPDGRARRGAATCGSPTATATTCCTASTSTCAPGERLAVVGPSGAGKSTLGRLLAGIHGPRTGASRSAACRWSSCRWTSCAGRSPWSPRSTTSSSASLRDNLAAGPARRAGDDELREALAAVDALDWVDALPDGLDTEVGSGGRALTPAQAQQIALARLVLADPHTLVLDEATSLLDPRAARHLERSLAAVLDGPHGRRDRAPAAHRARRRPGRGGRGRADHRARQPRRAGRGRRRVRRAVALLADRPIRRPPRSEETVGGGR